MKKVSVLASLLVLAVGSFLAGTWYNQRTPSADIADGGRKILYYVDPMHPAYKSDKPGIAPDCGMELVPVYEDSRVGDAGGNSAGPPGTVKISPEKQHLMGVRMAQVQEAVGARTLRLLGRVAADETRTYVINATIDGWITQALPHTTGSVVKKNETLASFYSPEFLSAGQALLFALSSKDRVQTTGRETPARSDQVGQFNINIQQYRDSLKNLGMGDLQIEEMIRTRKFVENVNITSPADGFILARNVSQGQRFDKGKELYRIADLRRVWILADVYKNEAKRIRPGWVARVTLPDDPEEVIHARVSEVLPQFDPTTRTLKVRLEADNPGYVLRPDMFVDVELRIAFPPAITVPVDALVDSGTKKTVYVDRGGGSFEPRKVETGWQIGDRVEIVKGLMPGERIVVSGTFLLDSESRMKAAAAGIYGETSQDPVCDMEVDEAKAAGRHSVYHGKTYVFCTDECKDRFDKDPRRYVGETTDKKKVPRPKDLRSVEWQGATVTAPETWRGTPREMGAASDTRSHKDQHHD